MLWPCQHKPNIGGHLVLLSGLFPGALSQGASVNTKSCCYYTVMWHAMQYLFYNTLLLYN